ncbi:hypothetical protein ASG84_10490 [Rhodococcus sp. Leaf278]|uniref:nuclear transport factor 2 family protein n=1 Tax=Rhodococcus sp. Leaf278 TaxID=1736319 RepID=UPI00070F94A9|nr:nuclear transport factor 2 family protein [Rhodococcus sp. Leaf278]KQU45746.1 hypothetical protein ASG84_10490 [Rhodococcus sp. Leaf278]
MTTEWDGLPDNVKKFMAALDARQGAPALSVFTAHAVVTDEGHDHSGRDEIEAWLTASVSESEYTYTTEFTGATTRGTTVVVTQHLEGNFPGGVADLHYRFTMDGALIEKLVIEP